VIQQCKSLAVLWMKVAHVAPFTFPSTLDKTCLILPEHCWFLKRSFPRCYVVIKMPKRHTLTFIMLWVEKGIILEVFQVSALKSHVFEGKNVLETSVYYLSFGILSFLAPMVTVSFLGYFFSTFLAVIIIFSPFRIVSPIIAHNYMPALKHIDHGSIV
jgi:hypothetical protein